MRLLEKLLWWGRNIAIALTLFLNFMALVILIMDKDLQTALSVCQTNLILIPVVIVLHILWRRVVVKIITDEQIKDYYDRSR